MSSLSRSSMLFRSSNRPHQLAPPQALSSGICAPLSFSRDCGLASTSYSGREFPSFVPHATKKEQQRPIPPSAPTKKGNNNGDEDDPFDSLLLDSNSKGGLLLLRWSLYATQSWAVPWSGKETALTMFAWLASFIAVGASLAPLAAAALGVPSIGVLPPQDKALFLLVNQVLETAVGLGVILKAVSKYPANELPRDLLRVDFRRPFSFDQGAAVNDNGNEGGGGGGGGAYPSKSDLDLGIDDDDDGGRAGGGWLSWALLGVAASPVAIGTAAAVAAALSDLTSGASSGGRGTADAVAGLLDASGSGRVDAATLAALLVVTAVLAPALEETVFRGFLLPSLTRVLPVPAAVVVSAAGFAAAHLSARDFPQLFAFGILLGFVYVRSRNLLSTMVIHGVWNGGVLLLLAALTSAGVDLEKLLAS